MATLTGNDISSGDSTSLNPGNYSFLQDYVHRESGIVLDGNKHYLLEARLMPIAREQELTSLNDLCALLRATSNTPLRQQVVDAITTNETLFFRDPNQYEALRNEVIPELLERRRDTRKLRFWSAAASSGQEAYSLAMMLLDMNLAGWSINILGTDLSVSTLERARAAKFLQIEVNRGLPAKHLVKYFTRSGMEWQLKDEVRNMVRFETFDLRRSMSARGPFDVVFCKNVLIYFDIETKKKVLEGIRGTLLSGGYLLLGGSETVLNLDVGFERKVIGNASIFQVS